MNDALLINNLEESCTGCGACVNICPKKSLKLLRDTEGFYYPVNDPDTCINCGLCEKVCHVLCNEKQPKVSTSNNYIYASSNKELKSCSSSGGAFSLFAEYILSLGGHIYASYYNGDNNRFEFTNSTRTELKKIRKTRYIESYTGNIFNEIFSDLKDGNIVLFCGTPCQVRGLKKFLLSKHMTLEKIYFVDFICHGVPSSKCFDEYKTLIGVDKDKIDNVDFRYKDFNTKRHGWHNLSLCFYFHNGSRKIIPYDPPYYYWYYKPFEDSLILRKCCFDCDYISSSEADVTIGDFWGVTSYDKSLDDNTGISIVKIHSERALSIFDLCTKNSNDLCKSVLYDDIKYAYKKKDKRQLRNERDAFFESIKRNGYAKAIVKKYGVIALTKAFTIGLIKTTIKNIVRK